MPRPRRAPARLVDLSHEITEGMVTYPGIPGPRLTEFLSWDASHERYAPGTEFHIGAISLVANTGTYLDTPAHRYREGDDLSLLGLERVAGVSAVVHEAPLGMCNPGAQPVFGKDELVGRALLIHTGWSRFWGTSQYGDGGHPYVDEQAVRAIVLANPAVVGIDSVNIDDTRDAGRPAHTRLLAAGIPIVEHLTNLELLAGEDVLFTAVPPRIRGLATFPVRAYATVLG